MSAMEKKQVDQRAGAVCAARNTVPTLSDSNAAQIAMAADRFMARSEIAATIRHGSNGFVARLPVSASERLALWETWPDAGRCLRLAQELDRALSVPADADQVSEAVAGLIAAFPTGERAASGYREAMAAILAEEAAARGWSAAVVTRGLLDIARTSRFLPALVEAIGAVAEADQVLRRAAWAAKRSVELGYELKWGLIDDGLIEFEDDGEAF